jgi:hypothetical protein
LSNQNGNHEETKDYNETKHELELYNDQVASIRFGNSWPRPYLKNKLEKIQHNG